MKELLRTMVFSAYDLQKLRIQMGLRLCANFRSQLTEESEEEGLSEEAVKVIDELKKSYRRLTDGIAKNRTLPKKEGFQGDDLISDYVSLVLVHQYLQIEKNERSQFANLETVLEDMPIYTQFLKGIRGIGPAMAGVCIAYLDPHKAERPSDFWAYCGLDVVDGKGRSRRQEHLVEREYTDKNGEIKTRMGVTYNPWLKSRLLGAMGSVFLRTPGCPYRTVYDNYKHRLLTDPSRNRVTVGEYKKAYAKWKKDPESLTLKVEAEGMWPPGRLHRAALRYAVKIFLLDLWNNWRALEGLKVYGSYQEEKLGRPHAA